MFLKIKDPKKAQELLKTNRPLKEGQTYYGPEKTEMQALAAKFPDVFERGYDKGEEPKKKEKPSFGPSSNKLLHKTEKSKFKDKKEK
mgnify:CR=1 FL=1